MMASTISKGVVVPKVAIVTGAASGIGFATSRRLAEDDWQLALVDVDEARLAEKASALSGDGATVKTYPFDLFEAERFSDVTDRVVSDLGSHDLLVNDAGIGVAATLLETSTDDW